MSTARIPDGTPRPMRFAYADPPYPGQAWQYRGHPDYAGEVDHQELIGQLCLNYPDGWALSTNGISIQQVLMLCPSDVRVAIWHVTNAPHPGAAPGWWWCWEPVIIRGGRPGPVRTLMACGHGRQEFLGRKPPAFTRWMLELLGAVPTDQIDDLFPGSGSVARAIDAWRQQPKLPAFSMSGMAKERSDTWPERYRNIAKTHDSLDDGLEQIPEPRAAAQGTLL